MFQAFSDVSKIALTQTASRTSRRSTYPRRSGEFIEGQIHYIIAAFNIDQDLAEKNNLAAKHPGKVTTLTKLMNDSRTPSVHPNFKLKSERK